MQNLSSVSSSKPLLPVQEDEEGQEKAPPMAVVPEEITNFVTPCPISSCSSQDGGNQSITKINIPHFKEMIIMSFQCKHCGYKSNDVQLSGGTMESSKYGTKLILRVCNELDLHRDVVKSDTAGIEIPEIELSLDEGGLGGFYTTVEGLLDKMYHQLKEANPYSSSSSSSSSSRTKNHNDDENQTISYQPKQHTSNTEFSEKSENHDTTVAMRYMNCLENLDAMKKGERFPFTIIINDPMSNSYISSSFSSSAQDSSPSQSVLNKKDKDSDDLKLKQDVSPTNYGGAEGGQEERRNTDEEDHSLQTLRYECTSSQNNIAFGVEG